MGLIDDLTEPTVPAAKRRTAQAGPPPPVPEPDPDRPASAEPADADPPTERAPG